MTRQSDVEVRHHGSIYLVVPHDRKLRLLWYALGYGRFADSWVWTYLFGAL